MTLHPPIFHPRLRGGPVKAGRILVVLAVLASSTAAGELLLRSTRGAQPHEILPRSAVLHLSLSADETPPGYALIRDPPFLASMGMSDNPGYIGNLSQLEAVAARGGLISILAVYGQSGQPRLMLNGVFFRSEKHLVDFVAFQQKKRRPVVILRKVAADGLWLFIVARDRAAVYTVAEQGHITASIERYRQRIGAELLFEAMWNKPGPVSVVHQ